MEYSFQKVSINGLEAQPGQYFMLTRLFRYVVVSIVTGRSQEIVPRTRHVNMRSRRYGDVFCEGVFI